MRSDEDKNFLGKFYDEWSKDLLEINVHDETLAIHFGYYEKEIKTLKKAILHMNDYVAELLYLKNKENLQILDAGCGVGGTSIYLAKKFPKVNFTGISIAHGQIQMANKFAKNNNVKNTRFIVGNYLDTGFADNSFDGIFALESSCYSLSHKALENVIEGIEDFINEMYRILKPGGRLVVVDSFRTPRKLSFMMKKMYRKFCVEFGYANLAIITDFEKYLKNKGFEDIVVENISKNVSRSVFQFSVMAAPYYASKTIRNIFRRKLTNSKRDYYQGNAVIAGGCGLLKIIGYYGTSAKKPKL